MKFTNSPSTTNLLSAPDLLPPLSLSPSYDAAMAVAHGLHALLIDHDGGADSAAATGSVDAKSSPLAMFAGKDLKEARQCAPALALLRPPCCACGCSFGFGITTMGVAHSL